MFRPRYVPRHLTSARCKSLRLNQHVPHGSRGGPLRSNPSSLRAGDGCARRSKCNLHLIKRLTSATKSFFLHGFRFTRVSERKVSNLLCLSRSFLFDFLPVLFPDPRIFQNLDEPSCFALFHRSLSCKF